MIFVLVIAAACVGSVYAVAWLLRGDVHVVGSGRHGAPTGAPRPCSRETVLGRCVLCHAPLPTRFVTREEVIARVEHLIDADTAAVAKLLSGPPSGTWAGVVRS